MPTRSDARQAYGKSFSRAYHLMWTDFADRVAPGLLAFYRATEKGRQKKPVLDLCCGTGTLALHFLAAGYPVTGVDLSPHMLGYAREDAREFVASKKAGFIQADVVNFKVKGKFGLVVSTYDALNHLESLAALKKCLARAASALEAGGHFIADLNTALGLQHWDEINVHDTAASLIVKRGGYDAEHSRAFFRVSGFLRDDDGRYERFEEIVVETAFKLALVKKALLTAGFRRAYFAQGTNLVAPLADPELEDRVFVVAKK